LNWNNMSDTKFIEYFALSSHKCTCDIDTRCYLKSLEIVF
jgi:hypothetical protein